MFRDLLNKLHHELSGEDKLRDLCGPQWGGAFKGQMKSDHGERTNPKLNDQPFYHRGSKGKMKRF
ncbi:hypothetical protein D3C87_1373190 [compost metagenome]